MNNRTDIQILREIAANYSLEVHDLDDQNLIECVRITITPSYVSTDIADMYDTICHRNGVVIIAKYNNLQNAKSLFDTIQSYVNVVLSRLSDVRFYLLAYGGYQTYPDFESILASWTEFEPMVHSINKSIIANWLIQPHVQDKQFKIMLLATIPDANSLYDEDKLYAIIQEQDEKLEVDSLIKN